MVNELRFPVFLPPLRTLVALHPTKEAGSTNARWVPGNLAAGPGLALLRKARPFRTTASPII